MKVRKRWIAAGICIVLLAGCGNTAPLYKKHDNVKNTVALRKKSITEDSLELAESYRKLYESMKESETTDLQKQVIEKIGDQGYPVLDTENQINMVNASKAEKFCESAQQGEKAGTTIICVTEEGGFVRYDLKAEDGRLDVVVSSLKWEDGEPEVSYYHEFEASEWMYTEKGYLFFEEFLPAGYDGAPGERAIRIKPLDQECRESYEKYIEDVGYERNNLLSTDWKETDLSGLELYDLYEKLSYIRYGVDFPYKAYEGAEYEIPEKEVEDILKSRFSLDVSAIRRKMVYHPETRTYRYRPRGLYDGSAPYGPYPEVTAVKREDNGKIRLTVEAVWEMEMTDCAMKSELVIRLLEDGTFQYVSNQVTFRDTDLPYYWYKPRLTEEEWEGYYGEKEE